MAESTATAYTPNTLTGNLFSPPSLCLFIWGTASQQREEEQRKETEWAEKKKFRCKRQRRQRATERGRRENRKKEEKDRRDSIMHFTLLLFDGFISGIWSLSDLFLYRKQSRISPKSPCTRKNTSPFPPQASSSSEFTLCLQTARTGCRLIPRYTVPLLKGA